MNEVARRLLGRLDELSAAMVAAYRERIPEYMALLQNDSEDVRGVSRVAAKTFLEVVIHDREPNEAELNVIRRSGQTRAAQGIALEAMLQAYAVGREIVWQFIEAEAQRSAVDEDQIAMVAHRLTRFMDRLTLMVTQGFLDHMRLAYEEERQRLTALADLGKAVNRSLDLAEVVTVGLERTLAALGVEYVKADPDG